MVTMLSSVGRRKNNTAFGFNPDVAFSYIAEYVSSAMDAAQRSLSALKAAQWKYGLQGIAAVKTALDFHIHDMDGFVNLVQLALEEIDI